MFGFDILATMISDIQNTSHMKLTTNGQIMTLNRISASDSGSGVGGRRSD